jgi:NADH-quinone oxidoreductase subunit C
LNIYLLSTENIIKEFRDRFHSNILNIAVKNDRRVIISIQHDSLTDIADYLYRAEGFRFIIASALHSRKGYEIHYHFSKDTIGLILNIHVVLDKVNPQVESLSNMFSASNWIEREMHELLGINFLNHPNQEKLISEGNWSEGVYPLRKNFK